MGRRLRLNRLIAYVAVVLAMSVAAGDPYGILIKPIPDKTVVLSFDDGCKSDAKFVAPLLRKHGFNATFYITETAWFKSQKDKYMTWEEIKSIEKMGFEIGNHTVHHWGLSPHSLKSCIMTTEGIEAAFKKHRISPPKTFCWPLYSVNLAFVPVLSEKGYTFARGGGERPYDPMKDSPLNVPSFTIHDRAMAKDPQHFIKKAQLAKNGKVTVFCFHGVPDLKHPGVGLKPESFAEMMAYLKENKYNVISVRDLGQYIDAKKALLYLHRPLIYPWGGRALSWGWVSQKGNMLYIGISKLPADRKLTLPDMTTKISKTWFLADSKKKAIPVSVSDKGISTITVPAYSPDTYGTSPVLIAAELKGGPAPTILDFAFPGLPTPTIEGNEIRVVVPKATDLQALAPVYTTGSAKVTGKPASGVPQDFSRPRKYTIRSSDGRSRTYTVAVERKLGAVGFANPGFDMYDVLKISGKPESAMFALAAESLWNVSKGHKNATVGTLSFESPHLMAIPPRDGSRFCGMLGGKGSSIFQSVVFDEGAYTITLDRTISHRVPGETHPAIHVTLDGKKIMTLDAITSKGGWAKTAWKQYTSPKFSVDAGLHKISFVIDDADAPSNYAARRTNLIDNVRIEFHE